MKKVVLVLAVCVIGQFLLPSPSTAQHGHGGVSTGGMKMETKDVLVEGVKISFMVMANNDHKKMRQDMKMKDDMESGTTHNVTVVLKDQTTQKEIDDAQVTMKVVDPKGKDQIKPLKYESEMKSYDAYFNMADKGKYQVMVLFKAGEKKRTAGIYYEVK
jgi:hypothetical protein